MSVRADGSLPEIRELVVVEGLRDRQAVERAVRADVWVTGGDRLSRTVVEELRRAALTRGVIVLTDPDGAGERIRRRLDELVPGCKHAFLRRTDAASAGEIGVEHATPEAIRKAIMRAATKPSVRPASPFTLDDLARAGLVRAQGAAGRRQRVGERLGIGYGNAKAFVRKLNLLGVTREEWERAVAAEKE
ncbi:MAG: ribonuclease M5 [Alicyclobacillaceae bacterium]|nr:ribonuclease M5 [Alicyclobacillaceae bacterium]